MRQNDKNENLHCGNAPVHSWHEKVFLGIVFSQKCTKLKKPMSDVFIFQVSITHTHVVIQHSSAIMCSILLLLKVYETAEHLVHHRLESRHSLRTLVVVFPVIKEKQKW